MSNETSVQEIEAAVGADPGVLPVEPDLKSERVQEESVSPDGPVQAG